MLDRRPTQVVVLGALAMLLALAAPSFSTAIFTSSTASTATVRAAVDWVAPQVTLIDLPEQVSGATVLEAAASDEHGTGVASVSIETRADAQSLWVTLCVATGPPYRCSWDTTGLADGVHEVRASAVDHAGFSATSDVRTVTVHNPTGDETAPVIAWASPPEGPQKGTIIFEVTATDSGSGVATVVVQHSRKGGDGTWADLCIMTRSSTDVWSCTVDTRPLPNGNTHFRAVATDEAGNSSYSDSLEFPITG